MVFGVWGVGYGGKKAMVYEDERYVVALLSLFVRDAHDAHECI